MAKKKSKATTSTTVEPKDGTLFDQAIYDEDGNLVGIAASKPSELPEEVPGASGESGPRTKKDRWREWIGQQMIDQVTQNEKEKLVLSELESKFDDAKKAKYDQHSIVEAGEKKLTALAMDLVAVERGTFVPPLFDGEGNVLAPAGRSNQVYSPAPTIADPGESAPLAELGFSEAVLTKLADSQLAKEMKLATVADLERAIAADEWWYRKAKGIGKKLVDQIIDAIVAYRAKNPKPSGEPDDGRRKQCLKPDCQQHHTAGLFVESFIKGSPQECPVCGETKYFELVDPQPIYAARDAAAKASEDAEDAEIEDLAEALLNGDE